MFEKQKSKRMKLRALDERFTQCSEALKELNPRSEEYGAVLELQNRIIDQRNKVDPPVSGDSKASFMNSFVVIGSMILWEKSHPVIGGAGDIIKRMLTKRN